MEIVGTAFRYGVVGVIGTLTHVGIMVFLVESFGVSPPISSVVGFIVTVIISYILNRHWTFSSRATSTGTFARYVVVSCTGVILTYGLMVLTVDVLQWYYLYGQLVVIMVIPTTNFILNYFWAFGVAAPKA